MEDRFEEAGLRVAAIVVDPVEQNAAMVEKLLLPFPVLSDPQADVIRKWGVFNEREQVAKPAIFLVRPDMSIGHSYVGRDYADRPAAPPRRTPPRPWADR